MTIQLQALLYPYIAHFHNEEVVLILLRNAIAITLDIKVSIAYIA